MQNRFQIEDLVAQSETGVVFRARDHHTGAAVALRRFFPFGPAGGGLMPEEQEAYQAAIGRLAGVRHPALRAIIAGGCDKVDGIPFIVTEWVDGGLLAETLAEGPLPAEHVRRLVSSALEVSELLSRTLGEEAVWVETQPGSVVVASEGNGREFTFWISPIRWLGSRESGSELAPILTLAEAALHWQGRVVSDQAGRGLGGWLKWVRNTSHATLRDARETLAASFRPEVPAVAEPPAPAAAPARAPQVRIRHSSSRGIWWIAGSLACVAAALGWAMMHRDPPAAAKAAAAAERVVSPTESVAPPKPAPPPAPEAAPEAAPSASADDERRRQIEAFNQANAARLQQENQLLAEQQAAIEARGGVYFPTDEEILHTQLGSPVSLEGTLDSFTPSKTNKTLYLIFRENTGRTAPRGAVLRSKLPEVNEAYLEPLVGRRLRIQGTLRTEPAGGRLRRLKVEIPDKPSIEQLD